MAFEILLKRKKKITRDRSVWDVTRVHVQKRASPHGDLQISRLHTHRAEQRCRLICRLLQITRLISKLLKIRTENLYSSIRSRTRIFQLQVI